LKFVVDDSYALSSTPTDDAPISKVADFKPHRTRFSLEGHRYGRIDQRTDRQGVAFERFPGFPRMIWGAHLPDGTKVAWFKDPMEMLSLAQFS